MSGDYGIKPEWKEAWILIAGMRPTFGPLLNVDHLAEGFLHLLAGWMRERFAGNHEEYQATSVNEAGVLPWYCAECGQQSNWDSRHNYTDDDWLQAARDELGK